jgi:hypothetical protein
VKKKVALIGGGPSTLIAAYFLSDRFDVHIYEKEKTIGRKFLVAGKGGFNLTNAISPKDLPSKYTSDPKLANTLNAFTNKSLRMWLAQLYIPTYEGTSGRVFPEEGMKPFEVLRKIEYALLEKGVHIHTDFELTDYSDDLTLQFKNQESVKTDFLILALGGASWSKTGSNGEWINWMDKKGINTKPFQASNCGIEINWPKEILEAHEGKPLKNISISCNNQTIKGEAVITKYGLEGNAIYPISSLIRDSFNQGLPLEISIDLKPQNTVEELIGKVSNAKDYKSGWQLNSSQLALFKSYTTKEEYLSVDKAAELIKNLVIPVANLRPIEEAISTVGGISFDAINEDFSLKTNPKVYVMGEMIDWDAPTGGFLLQGCFSTGFWVAKKLSEKHAD